VEKLDFKTKAKRKLVENLLSIKVWVVFSVLIVSTALVLLNSMSGSVWASVNGGIITTICGMREAFKIIRISESEDKDIMA